VWGGIIGNKLIGLYILPPRLNAVSYLYFLNNHLAILLEDVPLLTRQNMWYLHDGVPAHFAREVRTWLDQNFPEGWIGRNGPVLWPPRSLDLNHCDFFLWGHMKQLVYVTPVNTIEELRSRIEDVAAEIRGNAENSTVTDSTRSCVCEKWRPSF
jgi:hypothetical protein